MSDATYISVVKRLKRAEGHLRSLISMIEAGSECVDVAQQLHAVENALANAKREMIHDHLNHCLEEALANGAMSAGEALQQARSLTKYL